MKIIKSITDCLTKGIQESFSAELSDEQKEAFTEHGRKIGKEGKKFYLNELIKTGDSFVEELSSDNIDPVPDETELEK